MFKTSAGLVTIGVLIAILAAASAARVTDAGRACTASAALPFENLSRNRQQQYFTDGVHDALTTALAGRRDPTLLGYGALPQAGVDVHLGVIG
jgi:hypothetical protein